LRFNTTDQTILTKTLSTSPTNRKKTTLSFWFKKSKLSTAQGVITSGASGTGGSATGTRIYLNADDTFIVDTVVNNSAVWGLNTTRKFRDPSAWIHFCMSLDTTQSTASDRVKIYFNGVQETSFSSASYPSQDYDDIWAYGNYRIGDWGGDYGYYIGYQSYIAEVITIDGQALDPSSFTETDATTGQLIPKNPSGLTFGTNGFHLKFADNSGTSATTLGKDSSGNGNNFTPNNFSVAAGLGNDSMKDTPTNNFSTFNAALPIGSSSSYSNGNLEFNSATSSQRQTRSTFAHNSGKWYAEIRLDSYSSASGSYPYIGVAAANTFDQTWVGAIGTAINTAGTAYINGSSTSGGFSYTSGDIIGIAMDVDNLLVYFYKNGTIQNSGTGFAITANDNKGYQFAASFYASSGTWAANLGGIGIGSYSDANGHGNFTYSVPSGYLAECSANLPDPTILLPNKHFAAFTYTGTGSSGDVVNITNSDVDFTPDLVWVKTRDVTNDHILSDSVRGGSKYLVSSETYVEQTDTDKIRAFIQNGFESGTDGDTNWSGGRPFVAWNWNAGGSTGTNNDGSGTSQVRANASAGISIVSYTGNSTGSGVTQTIGHGLGVTPQLIIIKSRSWSSGDANWVVYHHKITDPHLNYLKLNSSSATITGDTAYMNQTSPTSTVFSLGYNYTTNKSSETYIAYCFSEVAGYSKFGSYTGNGSSDGTFVYTGFRPAWVMIKNTSGTGLWIIADATINSSNVVSTYLQAQGSNAEYTGYSWIDLLSNGFKARNTGSSFNTDGSTMIYFAFAESPFKNSRAR
jgi:hypothetical protein